jgi:predicted GNAT family acetyltransferase/DNA-binding transcriptional ArsR family regulator
MTHDLVRSYGYLTLGTRLKRLGERLQDDVATLAAANDFNVPAGLFPILAAVAEAGAPTIGELAPLVGVSQPAVTRGVLGLVERGLVAVERRSADQRLKTVTATPKGAALVARAQRVLWPAIADAVRDLTRDGDDAFLAHIDAFEDKFAERSLGERAADRLRAAEADRLVRLDRPIWHALTGRLRPASTGTERARRMRPEIGPFAACVDDATESLADLAALVATHGPTILLQADASPLPPGCRVEMTAVGVQMLLSNPEKLAVSGDVVALGDADAAEMLALAQLTQPGPFAARTHTLGRFWGVRVDGRLAAMAGERFQPDGLVEVSGVCTHPDFRGRGLAARLVSKVAADISARGEDPFLHTFASNAGAIRVYESLGFTIRREMTVTVLVPA